jgi:hypothetical protein
MIQPGGEIPAARNRHFPALDVVPFEEEDSPFVGLLLVEAA